MGSTVSVEECIVLNDPQGSCARKGRFFFQLNPVSMMFGVMGCTAFFSCFVDKAEQVYVYSQGQRIVCRTSIP